MKNIVEQLARYKSVHLNKKNIQTHFVGIPLIILGLTMLMNSIAIELQSDSFSMRISLAMVLYVLVACYYVLLHRSLAFGMIVFIIINLLLAAIFASTDHIFSIGIGLFLLGWLIQFIGHYFEKAKPAFVDDLSQFAIGPLFLMAETYFSLGLLKELENEITPLAIEKRRQLTASLSDK